MEDFDFDDKQLDEIGKLTNNKLIQGAIDGIVSLDTAALVVKGKASINKIEKRIQMRKQKIERMMETGPFWRKIDKFSYVVGSIIIMIFCFLLGRYPYTYIFPYA